jgi:hypothetical protein
MSLSMVIEVRRMCRRESNEISADRPGVQSQTVTFTLNTECTNEPCSKFECPIRAVNLSIVVGNQVCVTNGKGCADDRHAVQVTKHFEFQIDFSFNFRMSRRFLHISRSVDKYMTSARAPISCL